MVTYLQTLFLWYPNVICKGLVMTVFFEIIIYNISGIMTKSTYKIRLSRSWKKRLVLSLYVSIVFMLTIALRQPSDSFRIILIPFKSYKSILNHSYIVAENIFENIIMLIPFGVIFPMTVVKEKMVYVLKYGFFLSLLIEVLQLVMKRGYFEVDDIINNFIGVVLERV